MRTRRQFLATACWLGAAGLDGLVSRSRESAAAGTPRTIHLEARDVRWELAPGKTIQAVGYNGQVPGPEIRAREGERLRIVLKNSLAEPTTIHWPASTSRTPWTASPA